MAAGVTSYGASFVSIDKYGLDAAGAEASAASDPADSTWFWNNDLWGNYLIFVGSIHQTVQLPVILWQSPVGHINSTAEVNPYSASGTFPDLTDTNQSYMFQWHEEAHCGAQEGLHVLLHDLGVQAEVLVVSDGDMPRALAAAAKEKAAGYWLWGEFAAAKLPRGLVATPMRSSVTLRVRW